MNPSVKHCFSLAFLSFVYLDVKYDFDDFKLVSKLQTMNKVLKQVKQWCTIRKFKLEYAKEKRYFYSSALWSFIQRFLLTGINHVVDDAKNNISQKSYLSNIIFQFSMKILHRK